VSPEESAEHLMSLKPHFIYVDDEEWEFIQELLAEPPKDLPKLRELFAKPSVFTQED